MDISARGFGAGGSRFGPPHPPVPECRWASGPRSIKNNRIEM
jgi:hypothetical protein